jgi:A/G-specific adenine glycosylase
MAVAQLQYNGRTIRPAPKLLTQMRRSLTAWYARRARDLPWRATDDPYAIWVSEVMLQQTQVATVVPYYERFLEAFPTVEALAAAPEESVLRLWEGLGYYRRARNLHRAARIILSRHGGRVPQDSDLLRALPGIGRYTAGAILSIAFGRREPILEANSRRVLVRLFALPGDPSRQSLQKILWSLAHLLLPQRNPGRFNQALMELGATVCVPKRPRCPHCPLQQHCQALQQGRQDELPSTGPKPDVEQVREAAIVVRCGRHVLLVRRPATGRWSGMFDFPRVTLGNQKGKRLLDFLRAQVCKLAGVSIDPPRNIGQIKHGVTRFRISLECYEASVCPHKSSSTRRGVPAPRDEGAVDPATTSVGEDARDRPTLRWVSLRQLSQLPMSVPARRLSKIVLNAT